MPFQHRVRVRYAETDAQGVAHHSAYVAWLEEARIEALRSVGHSYRGLEEQGVFMPVTGIEIRYRKSAGFDDVVVMSTTVAADGRFQLAFHTSLSCGDQELASATVRIACLDGAGKLQRFPAEVLAALDGAGASLDSPAE